MCRVNATLELVEVDRVGGKVLAQRVDGSLPCLL
jgi:hypothetical protein